LWAINTGVKNTMTIEQVLLEALQDCITEDGAVAFKQMEPAEMVKNMERRLRTITVIARAAIDKSSQKENCHDN